MEKASRILVATVLAFAGLALANRHAAAADAAKQWKAPIPTITVSTSPLKNLSITGTSITGRAFLVSASIPVPYADLNLKQEDGAAELGRRIKLAAVMACEQLDLKYPREMFPVLGPDNCVQEAAGGGMAEAATAISDAKKR